MPLVQFVPLIRPSVWRALMHCVEHDLRLSPSVNLYHANGHRRKFLKQVNRVLAHYLQDMSAW
jgi:hypothetical protein